MTHKILLADDNPALLASLTVRLRGEGYEVVCASDGYQAVEQARKSCPSVALLDVNMPAGDGFTVQDRIEKMTDLVGIPVIYLTGERSDRVKFLAESHHAFAVLYKPFETDELLALVQDAIKSQCTEDVA